MKNKPVPISVTDLQFDYRRNRIYESFSLELSKPAIYGLFGRNGSGKSTLLKILSGLLYPTAGSVEVLGFNPSLRRPDFLQQVYIVPEEFHLPSITMMALLKTHAPFYPAFSIPDFNRYVDIFDLPSNRSFSNMSLGQKKKAVIAFALATNTPILLMDEPTNGLDIVGRSQFKSIIGLPEHAGRTVIISTHQAHDLESLMGHVLFVDNGRIALSASMDALQGALEVGLTDDREIALDSIYYEAFGQQWSYLKRNDGNTNGVVHLELLYKALSNNQNGVLEILSNYQVSQGVRI